MGGGGSNERCQLVDAARDALCAAGCAQAAARHRETLRRAGSALVSAGNKTRHARSGRSRCAVCWQLCRSGCPGQGALRRRGKQDAFAGVPLVHARLQPGRLARRAVRDVGVLPHLQRQSRCNMLELKQKLGCELAHYWGQMRTLLDYNAETLHEEGVRVRFGLRIAVKIQAIRPAVVVIVQVPMRRRGMLCALRRPHPQQKGVSSNRSPDTLDHSGRRGPCRCARCTRPSACLRADDASAVHRKSLCVLRLGSGTGDLAVVGACLTIVRCHEPLLLGTQYWPGLRRNPGLIIKTYFLDRCECRVMILAAVVAQTRRRDRFSLVERTHRYEFLLEDITEAHLPTSGGTPGRGGRRPASWGASGSAGPSSTRSCH